MKPHFTSVKDLQDMGKNMICLTRGDLKTQAMYNALMSRDVVITGTKQFGDYATHTSGTLNGKYFVHEQEPNNDSALWVEQ